jgi:MFS family permease
MVLFDFTSGAIILSLTLLMRAGNDSVFIIGVAMVLLSLVSALYTPTVTSSVPLLVSQKKLEGANGIVQAVQSLSAVAAPVLGGILYGAAGVQTVLVFSCISFILSAVMEIFIKIPFEKRELTAHIVPTVLKDMKDGFSYVAKQKFILKVGVNAVTLNLVLSPYFIVGGPIVLRVAMQSGDALYGAGMGIINFATILGALSVGFLSKKMIVKKLYLWIIAASLLLVPMALSLMPFILKTGFYPSFILFLLGAVPIAAIMMAVSQCASPIGQIMYGVIFKRFSSNLFIPTFIICAVTLLLSLLMRSMLKNEEN